MGGRAIAVAAMVSLAVVAAGAAEAKPPRSTDRMVVAQGGGRQGAWQLFARHNRRGELCVGLLNAASSGEGCGPPPGRLDRLAVGTSTGCQTGTFVYGYVAPRVEAVRVRYADGVVKLAKLYRSPRRIGFDGRFYLSRRIGPKPVKGVRALGAEDRLLQRVALNQGPAEDCA